MEITSALFSDLLPAALQQKQTPQGYTPDYYSQIQDYYAGYLPGQQTDTQALQNWYGSSMAGGTAGSSIPYGGIGVAPSANTINQLAPLFQGLAAANAAGSTGGDSYTTSLTPTQEAFFNFLDSPEGQSYKDARGAALSNVIGAGLGLFGPGLIGPAASLYNYMTDKPTIGDAIRSLISADQAGFQAAQDALTNYGSTSTARGPTTAAQAQALANQLANELSYALASDAGYGTTGPGSASGIGVGSTQGINSMDAMSDSVSSPSGGYSTASGIGVGSTEGINAMDAMSDAASSSSSDSSSSSKIVCTAMNESYGFGSFRNKIWLKYAADNLTKAHEVGYHTLFLPLVDLAYKKDVKPVRIVLENIARHRSSDLRAEMRGTKRDNVGRVYRAILEPICYFVGKLKGY